MKREFVMLAHVYDENKHSIAGWYMSEKLDGMRCLWDGGMSRGLPAASVPYANVEKDSRYINRVIATGLWTRYGKTIQAPDWWLDKLPVGIMLDGELYMGRGRFQDTLSIVKRMDGGGTGWEGVRYEVFDVPPPLAVLGDGEIKTTGLRKKLVGCYRWWLEHHRGDLISPRDFEAAVALCDNQERLPFDGPAARAMVASRLEEVVAGGGEGLMLRKPTSSWIPARTWDLLKVKKLIVGEGRVVGYVAGERTSLGSKLLGLMGSVVVELPSGKRFNLSGFTDEEREMVGGMGRRYLEGIPGQVVDVGLCWSTRFPLGSVVAFTYREMTDDGLPKEARFSRR